MIFHGGNIAAAAQQFGVDQADWIDLSTGINPQPYPVSDISSDAWSCLPDQGRMNVLIQSAASYYGGVNPEYVLAVSGTQTLLQILPHLFAKPKRVRIVAPTYKEHAHCWALAGHEVQEVPSIISAQQDGDIVIVVNPNNPTGQTYSRSEILDLADEQAHKGGLLIVDGAFTDCNTELDVSADVGRAGLLVLRSFGKFFGLAGIRLGFVLASGTLAGRLKAGIGPWPVNGPAMEIAIRAFQDKKWISETRDQLKASATRLDNLLKACDLQIMGGTSLFRYVYHPKAMNIYQALGEAGVLIRPFEDQAGYLRFGIPAPEQWGRVEKVLTSLSL